LAPGQRIEPKPMITLRPKYGMRMIVEQRKACASMKAPTSLVNQEAPNEPIVGAVVSGTK
jgi:hypothetical protein